MGDEPIKGKLCLGGRRGLQVVWGYETHRQFHDRMLTINPDKLGAVYADSVTETAFHSIAYWQLTPALTAPMPLF
jgi:hypothetical protein